MQEAVAAAFLQGSRAPGWDGVSRKALQLRLFPPVHAMADVSRKCISDALGVKPKAAPGGQDGRICGMSDGGIDAGEPGGGEPSRRLSGGRCGRSRRQSCAARCRRRGRNCPHWCGHYCTARCGAKCGRAPQGAASGARRSAAGSTQGSPVAKRRAQPHRRVTRNRIHGRHHRVHHRLHHCRQHPRQAQREHRRHRDRHRHHHRPRRRCAPKIVAECREVVQGKRGGAAAERGAAGDRESIAMSVERDDDAACTCSLSAVETVT